MDLVRELSFFNRPAIRERLVTTDVGICVGNFDGIHRGHQHLFRLLEQSLAKGGAHKTTKILLTFEPHPRTFFERGSALDEKSFLPITSFRQKFEFVKSWGFDYLFAARFNSALAELSPSEFVTKYLVQGVASRVVVVGYDWSFGKGRAGNAELLRDLGEKAGIEIVVAPPLVEDGLKISSSLIRSALSHGDVEGAGRLMGRPYEIAGRVRRGDQRGRQLGFPTANLHFHHQLLPEKGVYATRVSYGGTSYPAVTNIGIRPTFGGKLTVVESHLLDSNQHQLYGSFIKVAFVTRLRDEKRFESVAMLGEQIQRDAEAARRLLIP